jgi:hypothetical protein
MYGINFAVCENVDRARAFGRAGYERVQREFSAARMIDETAAVYRSG